MDNKNTNVYENIHRLIYPPKSLNNFHVKGQTIFFEICPEIQRSKKPIFGFFASFFIEERPKRRGKEAPCGALENGKIKLPLLKKNGKVGLPQDIVYFPKTVFRKIRYRSEMLIFQWFRGFFIS